MQTLEADWLTQPSTRRIMALLLDAGHQAYVVGGAVRNTLLRVPVTDIDIATSARPGAVLALAEEAGLRAIPTGADHGTVTVVVEDVPFEITTFRYDVETDGRHAVVAFTDDMTEDAARRDFTINALYADRDGKLLDPVGGLPDLEARRIVFVGDAAQRIEEDHLRSLRFFRFYAQYGDPEEGPDREALAAIADHLDGLETLAKERIGAEMRKLLGAANPAPSLATMQSCGALWRLLPGADVGAIAPLVHLEDMNGIAPDWVRRLAALGGEDPVEALRLSRQEATDLKRLRTALEEDAPLREIAWRQGAEAAWSATLIRHASLGTETTPDSAEIIARGAAAHFPLSAADLMPKLQGPALGAALSRAERHWIENDFRVDRKALLRYLDAAG